MRKFIPWKKLPAIQTVIIVIILLMVSLNAYYFLTQGYSLMATVDPASFSPSSPHLELSVKINASDKLNYGVVVDCGSSGSRVFVYCWEPHRGVKNELLNIKVLTNSSNLPVVTKIEPGLSSFYKRPTQASDYISPLLKFAAQHVPKDKLKETPLYILATAGLRLLTQEEQDAILNDLRADLSLDYDFAFNPSHVEVISGKDEAIYAWTSLNQVLGKFNHDLDDNSLIAVEVSGKMHVRKKTVGILDLGGASLQVALELPQTHSVVDPRIKEHVYDFNLGCTSTELSHQYKIYARTFLSHGSNQARSRYVSHLCGSYMNRSSTLRNLQISTSIPLVVQDPCLSNGTSEMVVEGDGTCHLVGSGNIQACIDLLKKHLNKSLDCLVSDRRRCSIDGVVLPEINFKNVEFYGFSEFFYTMHDILGIGGPYNFYQFVELAKNYCSTHWSEVESWKNSSRFPRADAERYRLQCFKSAWMLAVLHDGMNFPHSYKHLTSIQFLNNFEVHWSLGALIHKTKYFPLRDIERLSTLKSRIAYKSSSLTMTPYWFFVFGAVMCLILLSLFMIQFVHPILYKHQHSASTSTECDYDDNEKTEEFRTKMIRSRSYGIFISLVFLTI